MCSVVGTRRAKLDCSVLEEDWQRGQSYMAHWHSLALVPQHDHRPTVIEAERSEKHWEARRLLQRFLSGAISKTNYPHPEKHSTRRPHQPISDPSALGPKVQRGPIHVEREICCVTMRPKSTVIETSEKKKTVVKITKVPRFLG